jgi:hypothetical protein
LTPRRNYPFTTITVISSLSTSAPSPVLPTA